MPVVLFEPASGSQKPRSLFEVAAGPIDSERGDRTKSEKNSPNERVREMGSEQCRCEERTEDQPDGLHGEHECDQHATRVFSGILGHNRGRDRVVTADSDTKDEPKSDEPPDVRRKRAPQGSGRKYQDLEAVDTLASIRFRSL